MIGDTYPGAERPADAQSNIFSTPPGYNDPFGGTNSGYSMGAVFDGRGGSGLLASRNYQPGPFYNTRHSSGSLGSGAFHTKLAGQQSSTEVGGNPNSQQSGQQKLTSESSSESNDLSDGKLQRDSSMTRDIQSVC